MAVLYLFIYLVIYLEANCFTILWWFLPYIDMNHMALLTMIYLIVIELCFLMSHDRY